MYSCSVVTQIKYLTNLINVTYSHNIPRLFLFLLLYSYLSIDSFYALILSCYKNYVIEFLSTMTQSRLNISAHLQIFYCSDELKYYLYTVVLIHSNYIISFRSVTFINMSTINNKMSYTAQRTTYVTNQPAAVNPFEQLNNKWSADLFGCCDNVSQCESMT